MVEKMLAARSIEVTDVRDGGPMGVEVWPASGKADPARIGTMGDKWHLDEVVITIKGRRYLAMAGGGPTWLCFDVLDTKQTQCSSRPETDAQAAQKARQNAKGDSDRQAQKLRGIQQEDWAEVRASTAQRSQ
jgi:hypothetical protein